MKRLVCRSSFFLFLCFLFVSSTNAQNIGKDSKGNIYQKSSNKKKLIDGKEIIVKEPSLKLLSPSSVTTNSSSLQAKEIEPKKAKDTKPTKISKYGRKESSEIKSEENE